MCVRVGKDIKYMYAVSFCVPFIFDGRSQFLRHHCLPPPPLILSIHIIILLLVENTHSKKMHTHTRQNCKFLQSTLHSYLQRISWCNAHGTPQRMCLHVYFLNESAECMWSQQAESRAGVWKFQLILRARPRAFQLNFTSCKFCTTSSSVCVCQSKSMLWKFAWARMNESECVCI